jgi:hypothetical protein
MSAIESVPKGYEHAVNRIRYVNQEKEKRKLEEERKTTGYNYENLRKKKWQAPRCATQERPERRRPFVMIDVSVAPGK